MSGYRTAVVLVMAPKFPVQRFLLLIDRIMPMFATPFHHRLQAAAEPLAHRTYMNRELSLPASLTDVREAEKIECRGLRPTRFLGPSQGFSPEFHQPGLVRMQRQPVLLKSLPQHVEHFLGVLPILKAENEIVGK